MMIVLHSRLFAFALFSLVSTCLLPLASAQNWNYPNTRKSDQLDDYHGIKVADPYRWLEDDNSAETGAWVKAENEVTFGYLDKIPFRMQVRHRLEQLFNYARYTPPVHRGEYYIFSKNDGLQNQNVLYVQTGLDGAPAVLLDPNTFSSDGTSRLTFSEASRDGRYLAYGISSGGSDWQEGHVLEIATRKTLPDELKWIKASGIAWAGDGFYYSRYPAPQEGHALSSKNEFHQVYFHKVGTAQSADELIYEDKNNPERFHFVGTSDDSKYAFLFISDEGKGKKGNSLSFLDLSSKSKKFIPIVSDITDDSFNPLDNVDGRFLIQTNHNAPNSKIALYDPANSSWKDVIPEQSNVIDFAGAVGGKIVVSYLKDVASHVYIHSVEGKLENELKLPGVGTAFEFQGTDKDANLFFGFTSPIYPSTIFRYDIAARETKVYRAPQIPGFNSDNYETKQVFYTSKDGTRVPMFVTHKKGLDLNGKNPTLLYGYGGFNISETPIFRPLVLGLLEQGFVFASANLRGGGEYGEKWHDAGSKLNKQNVFDDFIAAAEWLIANKYTSTEHLAINGGSNGGLLVGAVMNQRPELFRVAVPQVGVMDMLRFQKFTIGWNWISDYGSSENADQFKVLYSYSPLHNIRAGVKYPVTLITTADHDDRVVPAHSFKYAATLQALASHDNPALIRIETKSGHGASSTTKAIEITGDVYSFIFYNLGVTPKY
jgi:prolyl oligopeptidase